MGIELGKYNDQLSAFFRQNPPTFAKASSSTQMQVAGKKYYYDNFDSMNKLFNVNSLLEFDLLEWYKLEPVEKIDHVKHYIDGELRKETHAVGKAAQEMFKKINGDSTDFELPDPNFIIDHLRPCRTLGESKKEAGFRFLHKDTQKLTEYDFHSVSYSLRRLYTKEQIDKYMAYHVHLRETYAPHGALGIQKDEESNNVYDYNRYEPPEWMALDVKPSVDPDITTLMSHLFPSETCREYVFTWIYHSLTSRAGTYLYLCGGQGSGKNTLANLVTRLHGFHNSVHPKQDSFKGRFNHYLKDKTFIFFDEFNCRVRQDKDILKQIINERIQIEGKNRDHEDIEVHASYFLANNSLEAIGLDPVDRRFSVPNVTHDSIVTVQTREWMREFSERIKVDDRMIAAFGHWILETFKEKQNWLAEEPYQPERFEEIVFATARMGIAETLQKVMNRKLTYYDYYEEKDQFKKNHRGHNYPNIADWQKFFRDVRKGGKPIGVVEGKKFTPIPELQPSRTNDTL